MAECTCNQGRYTIRRYLNGKVRNITLPDDAFLSICADAGIESSAEYTDTTQKQRDLAVAYFYVWICSPVTQTSGITEEDADWKHTNGGEHMSAKLLEKYLDMANDIFAKYGLPLVGEEQWGFVGRGIRNPRNNRLYNGRSH